ncbi:MAG: cysteine desulfurase family protein [bacterium]|nr:cysteine desulfurase family protein [bacterium]
MRKVFLDHASTTPLDSRVLAGMLRLAGEAFGNPSSGHLFGRRARALLDDAADQAAGVIGAARPEEIVFTSGGTEADNLALRGVLAGLPAASSLVVSAADHAAVLDTAADLEAEGRSVIRLPVDGRGRVDPEKLAWVLEQGGVGLVSIIWANNELGSINELPALAGLCRRHGAPFHTDAVQALGRLAVRVDEVPIDLLSGSAHKFGGPKGAGFLYVRRGTALRPRQTGGLQQGGRRGGTENVPGLVGLGLAIELAESGRVEAGVRLRALSRRLGARLAGAPGLRLLGDGAAADQLPGHFSLCFEEVEGEALLLSLDLDGIAVSSGSACHTGSIEPSHVLLAAGLSRRQAKGTIRLVLGRDTTEEDLDYAAARLLEHAARLRGTQ